jgi:hypothetical protein
LSERPSPSVSAPWPQRQILRYRER